MMRGDAFPMRRTSSCLQVVSDLPAVIQSPLCLNRSALTHVPSCPSKAEVSVGSFRTGALPSTSVLCRYRPIYCEGRVPEPIKQSGEEQRIILRRKMVKIWHECENEHRRCQNRRGRARLLGPLTDEKIQRL